MSIYLSGTDPTLIRPGLSRCRALLQLLGNPQQELRYLHITGTNGKGSTCACIASILRCADLCTGLFTSPALWDATERIQVDGQPISPAELSALRERVQTAGAELSDPPTEFEQMTALALCYFAQRGCDLVVLEVGLGGGEDATNVIPAPELAVFTAMGLEHTQILGDSLEKIATAKAGILKPGCTAISYGNQPPCNRVYAQRCRELGIPLRQVDFSRIARADCSLLGSRFSLAPYGELQLPLLGEYQLRNALTAITAIEALAERGWDIPPGAIRQGLAAVCWPGRLELLARDPLFLLDGSHNPQGLEATLQSLSALLPQRPVFLLSLMGDKAIEELLQLLLPMAGGLVTVAADNPRALSPGELAERIARLGGVATPCHSIAQGVALARELAGPQGAVCALGTLYFSAAVRRALAQQLSS